MLIRNKTGRILEVPLELAERMVKLGDAEILDEAPVKKVKKDVCPYCFQDIGKEKHTKCKRQAPLISIVIPSRADEDADVTLKSLKKQTYKKFEVILEVDKKKEGAPVMRNKGAKKAKGELILFSDNDIDWDKDALASMYKALANNPEAAYAYGSYTLDGKLVGNREFSSHDLWKWNYISTMSLMRKKDFDATGGFDPKIKKFQDWDLWLSMLEKGKVGVFCGDCLFKTKEREGITYGKDALDPTEARKVIMKKHSIKDTKLADIIIPHQNRHDCLKVVLDALSYDQFNIIVVSGKTFAENCNKGAKIAETDNLIFMNDDIEPNSDVIREMLDAPEDIVGAAQITPSWNPDKIYYGISYKWQNGFIKEAITDDYDHALIPTGFLFRIKSKVWKALKGFDERYKNGGEDQDLFLKALEEGYSISIVKTPTIHHHSQSRDRFKHTSDNRTLLNREWNELRIKKLIK